MSQIKRLQTIDADTLQSTAYEPVSFVVDDLLPQGLHLLAGAPKIGKSWLALWLCLCAAQGKPLWTFATCPCEVLYLCLEDSFQRIQSRLFDLTEDAPLDMRMSKSGLSAYDVVNNYDERQLADIIYRYGEEKFSRRIAANIVKARAEKPIETTFELVDIIKSSMPQKAMRDAHPARRTFQAIRIEVNAELDVLKSTLEDAFDILAPGGRIAIITFHSLEDRIVKEQFAKWCQGCTCPKEFPVCVCGKKPKGKTFKSISPSKEELEENPRARSSRLRIFEKF